MTHQDILDQFASIAAAHEARTKEAENRHAAELAALEQRRVAECLANQDLCGRIGHAFRLRQRTDWNAYLPNQPAAQRFCVICGKVEQGQD